MVNNYTLGHMKFQVFITTKSATVNPSDRAVLGALHELGYRDVLTVRLGKFLEVEVNESGLAAGKVDERKTAIAGSLIREGSINPIINDWRVEVVGQEGA